MNRGLPSPCRPSRPRPLKRTVGYLRGCWPPSSNPPPRTARNLRPAKRELQRPTPGKGYQCPALGAGETAPSPEEGSCLAGPRRRTGGSRHLGLCWSDRRVSATVGARRRTGPVNHLDGEQFLPHRKSLSLESAMMGQAGRDMEAPPTDAEVHRRRPVNLHPES